jgi:hypothetical protein
MQEGVCAGGTLVSAEVGFSWQSAFLALSTRLSC